MSVRVKGLGTVGGCRDTSELVEVPMTQYDARPPARRFTVAADGSMTGDDGDSGRLAASLRYACRVAGQLEHLTGAGDLEWVGTVSSTAVTARVGWSLAREVTLAAEVEAGPPRTVRPPAVAGGDVQAALERAMQRVRQLLGTHWTAVITGDKRVVAAAAPQPGDGLPDPLPVLPEVGVRALAVLGALEERYRETCVLLHYAHGTMLVAAIGDHALYAFADQLDARVVTEVVDEVRTILVPGDVAAAHSLWTGAPRTATAVGGSATGLAPVAAPGAAAAPGGPDAPERRAGARVRTSPPRRSLWGRRSS